METPLKPALLALVSMLATVALAAPFEGTVISRSGEPVAGASVALFQPEPWESRFDRQVAAAERRPLATASSDADGRFRVELPGKGVYELNVRAEGFAPAHLLFLDPSAEPIVLDPAALVSARVLLDGKPLPDARMLWVSGGGLEERVVSGADGRFEVVDPRQWAAGVLIAHPSIPVQIDQRIGGFGARMPFSDIRIDSTGAVSGRVTAAGKPIEGARITIGGAPAAGSDADGRFRLRRTEGERVVARLNGLVGSATEVRGRELDIRMTEGKTLEGSVEDEAGEAIPGASVSVWSPGEIAMKTVSGGKGAFQISALESAAYAVVAEAPGFETASDEMAEVDLTTDSVSGIEVILKRMDRLAGRVVDAKGKPVSGASVMLFPKQIPLIYVRGAAIPGGTTAPDGTFKIDQPAGMNEMTSEFELGLVVWKEGLPATRAAIPQEKEKRRDIRIELGGGTPIRGVVLDPDGKPVEGASVVVIERDEQTMRFPVSSLLSGSGARFPTTRADGTFEITVAARAHDVTVQADGFAPSTIKNLEVAKMREPLEVRLTRGGSASGRVVRGDGSPLAGATVMLGGDGMMSPSETDEDGQFRFKGLEPKAYEVTIFKQDEGVFESRHLTVPGEPLLIRLPAKHDVRGRVVEKQTGVPVREFTIDVSNDGPGFTMIPSQEFESEDGGFSIALAPGSYRLTITAPGYARGGEGVLVQEDGVRSDLEARLDRGRSGGGRVVDQAGRPISGASVSLEDVSSEAAETDARGAFELENLPPGDAAVTVTREGFSAVTGVLPASGEPAEFVLPSSTELTGMVVDRSGAPIEGASVFGYARDSGGTVANGESDATGAFRLTDLGRHVYSITVRKAGYAALEQSVTVGEENAPVRFVLREIATGTVLGSVTGGSEDDVMMISVSSGDETEGAMVMRSGDYRVESAPAGRLQVTLMNGAGSERRTVIQHVELATGGEARVDFDLSTGHLVRGRVTKDGVPLPGATIMFAGPDESNAVVVSRAGGTYETRLSSRGYHQVTVSANDLLAEFQSAYDAPGGGLFDIDIRENRFTGRVVDSVDETPIAGASVVITDERNTQESSVTADGAGRFAIATSVQGAATLRVSKVGYGHEFRSLPPVSTGEIQIELTPSGGLTVRLLDARTGQPLDGTVVARDVHHRQAYSGWVSKQVDGSIRVPLAAGAYRVSASSTGFATQTVAVSVPPGEVVLALTPGGTVVVRSVTGLARRGTLVAPNGEEYIRCECNGIAQIQIVGGETTIANVAPGLYTLRLEGNGAVSEHRVEVAEGGTTIVDVP